ncbi:sigma-70 family RNA polymerase sigma factor [Clostridium sp. D53t1_180928_C8]|uniref:sigma-70 family RNA polymerase sigma factor n=1 Tax=Clostridium sp. D53t1_180928_C8 TaxID=2787101 RepID=UPI0018AAEB84|nr:sigma-70 family RNA polymerase sigma factor [Clostridium sp. D53t1_180928_C8]
MKSLCIENKETINLKKKLNNLNYSSNNLFNTLCNAKNNDKNAILFLIEKYQPLIRKYAFKYKLKNYDSDDLIQIGNISVITAINKYNLAKGNEFIDSYIINTIKNGFRNLARGEIKYTSESSLNITVDENNEIEDLISDSLDLEDYIINSMMHDLLKTILATLSHDEHELIRIAYFTPNTTLYRYCLDNNLNYPKKRRELIALIEKLRKLIEI